MHRFLICLCCFLFAIYKYFCLTKRVKSALNCHCRMHSQFTYVQLFRLYVASHVGLTSHVFHVDSQFHVLSFSAIIASCSRLVLPLHINRASVSRRYSRKSDFNHFSFLWIDILPSFLTNYQTVRFIIRTDFK